MRIYEDCKGTLSEWFKEKDLNRILIFLSLSYVCLYAHDRYVFAPVRGGAATIDAATARERTTTRAMSSDVTWEDQQRICAFSRANARAHELDAEIAAKTKGVDALQEASEELTFCGDDACGVLLGECFVVMDGESAEAKVEGMLERERAGLEALKEERKGIREELQALKQVRRSTKDGARGRRLTVRAIALAEIIRKVREFYQSRGVIRSRDVMMSGRSNFTASR